MNKQKGIIPVNSDTRNSTAFGSGLVVRAGGQRNGKLLNEGVCRVKRLNANKAADSNQL